MIPSSRLPPFQLWPVHPPCQLRVDSCGVSCPARGELRPANLPGWGDPWRCRLGDTEGPQIGDRIRSGDNGRFRTIADVLARFRNHPARIREGFAPAVDGDPQHVHPGGGELEEGPLWLDRAPLAELSKGTRICERRLREHRQGMRRPRAERVEAIAEALVRMIDDP